NGLKGAPERRIVPKRRGYGCKFSNNSRYSDPPALRGGVWLVFLVAVEGKRGSRGDDCSLGDHRGLDLGYHPILREDNCDGDAEWFTGGCGRFSGSAGLRLDSGDHLGAGNCGGCG